MPSGEAPAVPAGVAALDRLSDRLLAGGRPLRVAVAGDARERDAIFRLRHRQVVGHGWAGHEPLGDGIERDAHDAGALHVGAWDGEALVGTVRMVLPGPERRLPVEEAFDVTIQPRGEVVEAGRLVIAPAYRGDPAHRAWGALFALAWLSARARGFSVLGGAASPRMVARLRALGLPFEVLGPARRHWGVERHPVRVDPAAGSPTWFEGGDPAGD